MDPVSMAVSGGIGVLGMGASMIMDYKRRQKAERALARMGKRPQLSVPKEVMGAYQNRLNRSKLYQGFTQAERNRFKSDTQSANAGLQAKMLNAGGSAQAIMTGLGNQNARANVLMAAESARMNRAGQANDLAAADQLAGQVGSYQTQNEQMAGSQYDNQVAGYGAAIREANQGMSNSLNTMAGLGMQGAISGFGGNDDEPYVYKGNKGPSTNRGGR
jgi:hypothetical protein